MGDRNRALLTGVVTLSIWVGLGLSACAPTPTSTSAQIAAQDLVKRLLPEQVDRFVFELIPPDKGADVYEVEGRGSQVVIRGNSGVSMAAGLQWYMKHHGYGLPSWFGSGVIAPSSVEPVQSKIRRVSWAQYRTFLHYPTSTYSAPWWAWPQWERLIDWMALNGVTMPLSVTGQEAVWQAVCRRLGLTEAQIEDFLPGPVYLPFGWLGTLDGWGGPLPQDWIDRHQELQKKILARERELGMTPVLQGFTGHVPPALAREFPDVKVHQIEWVDWQTDVLDPRDPLFPKVARFFMEEQTKLFGTDHFYAAETFIEMTPPSGDPDFLPGLSRAIYDGMAKTDPEAVWVSQAWTFHNQREFWMEEDRVKKFFDAVPDNAMIVLDTFSEVRPMWGLTAAFHGKPWVWGMKQNFGDIVQLGGAMTTIAQDLQAAREDPNSGSLAGVGVTSEGLGFNPAVHTLLFDMAWRDPSRVDLNDWMKTYSHHRYGQTQAEAEKAWSILGETAYTAFCPPLGRSMILAVPTLTPKVEVEPEKLWLRRIPYDNARLARAWEHLLGAANELANVDSYRYDLVNVARQVLSNYASRLHAEVVQAYEKGNVDQLERASQRFLVLIRDLDELVATRPEFLLGIWLEDAKRWGATEGERVLLEWNARRVLTLWGKVEEVDDFPRDYARKEWSGMLTGFYLKRWEPFLQGLADSLRQGKAFDTEAFQLQLLQWERDWVDQRETYPTEPHGDSLAVAQKLWEKYGEEL